MNGRAQTLESGPLTTLLDALREELGIHSPKAGCEQGGCGTCTVLVDGESRRSCLIPVGVLAGAEITTLEGLGTAENLSSVQQAFLHHYAAQCGFCTSGMIIAAKAYVDGGGTDDPTAIQEALAGHACRCTGYVKIIDAVAALARGDSFDVTTTAEGRSTTTSMGGAA